MWLAGARMPRPSHVNHPNHDRWPAAGKTVMDRNAGGPSTDARPHHRERQCHITEGNQAFALERSAAAGTPRRTGDLVPVGQLLVSVLRELFAKADAFEEDGE